MQAKEEQYYTPVEYNAVGFSISLAELYNKVDFEVE